MMRNKNVTRAVAAAVTTGFIGAALLVGTGTAHAAGDLSVTTAVVCEKAQTTKNIRMVTVRNVGDATITGVRVGMVAGPEVLVPKLEPGEPLKRNGVLISSAKGVSTPGVLLPGVEVLIAEITPGCDAPYAIVGYAIGNEIDNVVSAPNAAFDWGVAPPPAQVR
ncbi:MAG: hypothetical protein WAW85_15990 [Gordonia sp. (in: high G+C Gram-positive bacteria)]|uniref:hypothetical protein n=1 Tax=Gordonia sp. (in: high G+C Gram-positive bacteria) TaxID=84139 RepID=UPI003BB550FB